MNIEPGTRVRSKQEYFPDINEGTYLRVMPSGRFHKIRWGGMEADDYDIHLEDEFEVIDE